MNKIRTAAPSNRVQLPKWARFAAAQAAAGAVLAGIITATAVPAVAVPVARSVPRASVVGSSASGPLPRAFFGLGPASTRKIDGRPYFNWSATPGSFLTDHVAFVDFGVTPVTVRVFATNAISTAHGGTGFLAQVLARGGPAGWVTIHFPRNSPVIHLAPRSKVIVPITVVFPKNASPGDHVGAIVAALSSVIKNKKNVKVHFIQQVAVRIIARISGKLRPQLSVLGLHVSYSDPVSPLAAAPATVFFTVKNTGNELLGGKVSVPVHGLFGSTETRQDVITVPVMLPGGSDSARVIVPGVYPEFLMHATVTIKPLIATGQYDPGLSTYSAQVSFWAIPWILMAIVILLAAAGVLLFWRRRRRRAGAARLGGSQNRHPATVEA